MVSVFAVVAVEVEGEVTVLGEGAQELGEEFDVEGTDLLGHGAEVAGEVRSSPEVHDSSREGFYQGGGGVGEANEVRAIAQGLVEGASENEADIFDGMVVVHVEVAFGLYRKVHTGVVGEEVQDVVEETDASLYLRASFAVEFEANPYIRLARLPFGCPGPCRGVARFEIAHLCSDLLREMVRGDAHPLSEVEPVGVVPYHI